MNSDGEDVDHYTSLFKEPDDYYQSEKPATYVDYALQTGQTLHLRLVGHNPLWGHLLWNAGRVITDYLETHADQLVKNKDILELGAGSGLPSLVCAARGARKVVATDYPDVELIQNLQYNIDHCSLIPSPRNIVVEGYLWGNPIQELQSHLTEPAEGFDLLILADVVFNHSEHQKLIETVNTTLKKTSHAQALVFFTPYRPWLLEKDMAFFTLAEDNGFVVEKILERVMDKVMFENDPGDEIIRRTVFGYQLTRSST